MKLLPTVMVGGVIPEKRIGRRGFIDKSRRSSDLIPEKLHQMKQTDILRSTQQCFCDRLTYCQEVRDGQLEKLLRCVVTLKRAKESFR